MRAGVRRALVGGAIMLGLFGGVAGSASAAPVAKGGDILDKIAMCESGDRNIHTYGHSSAEGHWQVIRGTWRGAGGLRFASHPMGATRAQQKIVAQRILATQGLGAWGPSAHCWRR